MSRTAIKEHDRLLRAEAIMRDYEAAVLAATGEKCTITFSPRHGWYHVSRRWSRNLREAQVLRWTNHFWAEAHVKDINHEEA